MGRGGYIVGVKSRGENRRGWVNGQGDGRGNDNVINRVRGIILGGIEEGDEGTVIVGLKKVGEDNDEGGEDVVDIHGGRI